MPQVSIIVPVYNAADYLERSVESLLDQTFQDIEIILVNDGSTDNSGEICKAYAQLDSRIKVVNKENGGVSSARNKGLEMANGMYIGFIDSDDWVEKNMFEVLVKNTLEFDSDMIVCDYQRVTSDNNYISSRTNLNREPEIFDLEKIGISKYIVDYYLPVAHGYIVWNKLFKSEIIKNYNITFEPNKDIHAEDFLFNLYYVCHAKKIVTVPDVFINYYQRADSLSALPEALIYRLTTLVTFFENYARKYVYIPNETISVVFCALILSTLDYLVLSKDNSYIEGCISDVIKNKKFKNYSFRTLYDSECASYLKKKGYRLTGRIYFKFTLLFMILGQDKLVLRRLNRT